MLNNEKIKLNVSPKLDQLLIEALIADAGYCTQTHYTSREQEETFLFVPYNKWKDGSYKELQRKIQNQLDSLSRMIDEPIHPSVVANLKVNSGVIQMIINALIRSKKYELVVELQKVFKNFKRK